MTTTSIRVGNVTSIYSDVAAPLQGDESWLSTETCTQPTSPS